MRRITAPRINTVKLFKKDNLALRCASSIQAIANFATFGRVYMGTGLAKLGGLEQPVFSLRARRFPNWATALREFSNFKSATGLEERSVQRGVGGLNTGLKPFLGVERPAELA
jgi:hypothetical protein